MTAPSSSLKQTFDLMQQTGAEIARVRSADPDWLFIIVHGAHAQAALNRAIDAYEGLARHG